MPDMQNANDAFRFAFLRLNDVEQQAVNSAASTPRRAIIDEASDLDIIKSIFRRDGMDAGHRRQHTCGKKQPLVPEERRLRADQS